LSIPFTRKMSSKKVRFFPTSVLSSNGGLWKLENLSYLRMWTFDSFFFKSCLFLKNEIDNPPSNLTGKMMQCISIDWYLDTSPFILYAAVNAPKSPQKATIWSGIKNGKCSKGIRLSRYQSIVKKHFWVFLDLKFDCPFYLQESEVQKKWDFFQGLSFLQMAGWKNGKIWAIWKCELLTLFILKSCLFLRTEMDLSPWNFTGNTMQCISIDWYHVSNFTRRKVCFLSTQWCQGC
jgi:hypothetical protein